MKTKTSFTKKIMISAVLAAGIMTNSFANENNNTTSDLEQKIWILEKQIQDLNKKVSKTNKTLKKTKKDAKKAKKIAIKNSHKLEPILANGHLYFNVRMENSGHYLYYKKTNGDVVTNNIFTTNVDLVGKAKPSENLKATVILSAYNVWGNNNNSMQNTNQLANENPDDTNVRIKAAFFNYTFGPDNSLMFSAGRRPATHGFPSNLRNKQSPGSPDAHLFNVEFSGISLGIYTEALSKISSKFEEWGSWIKVCAGRGYAPNTGQNSNTPYSETDGEKISDFAGVIFEPFDNGHYSMSVTAVKAWNVVGMFNNTAKDTGSFLITGTTIKSNGIGDGINDFLDNTTGWISLGLSKTDPNQNGQLGTTDSKTGWSVWIGTDMPIGEDGDRFGINYVHGSKYWRNMTYGEDTLIGSIAAVRGNAFDIYYHHNLTDNLFITTNATLIKYDYTGSNSSFGDDGKPIDINDDPNAVKTAGDLKVSITYKF